MLYSTIEINYSILFWNPVRADATVIFSISIASTMVSFLYTVGNFQSYVVEFGDPLYLARSYKVAMILIKHGSDPIGGYRCSDRMPTILHHFCFTRSKGSMQAVLESGVPVNIPNILGQTPMFFAPTPEIVHLLFNAGHSVDWEDITGFRPLHMMISHNDCHLTVKALLDAKCNPNAEDNKGRTPLHIMCLLDKDLSYGNPREDLQNRLDTIKLLADYGASFTAKDNEGKTPLELLWIPQNDEQFEKWKIIKTYLIEQFDAQVAHGFKRARSFVSKEVEVEESDERGGI